jgi:chromosome segregation protein
MEDVIFNGSSSRQPLQMAEVSLKVSGLNGNSPDGAPQCTVSRRLYRNGESEYLMNGRTCRLRDIHELFMDTGLGSKAYSIIEQGKIGQILSSRPGDRRALIEEAAGITKYKARRRQTQLKLEAAQQNLLRVNDIVNEVEKQLESLKRQASKARRYRAVKEEMHGRERVLFGRRFLELMERSRTLEARHAAEAERERAAAIALETEEAQLEVLRQTLYEREAELERARTRLNELTIAVDRHQGRSGYCKQQIGETDARAEEAAREERELVGRIGPLGESLAGKRAEEERLREARAVAEAELSAAEAATGEAAATLAAAEAEQERAREAQVALLGRGAELSNEKAAVSGNAARAQADLEKLAAEAAELERERAATGAAREGAAARAREAEAQAETLRAARADAAARALAARTRAEQLAREVEAAQSEASELAGRRASLEEIIATHSAFDEGVRSLLGRPEGLEVLGVVADSIEAGSEHERAVEAFLGDRLQAVVVPDAAAARRGVRWLEEQSAGRGAFLPLASVRMHEDTELLRKIAAQEPLALGLLSDHYRVSGPEAATIAGSLPDALLVASLEDALEVAARQGPVTLVTLAGETLRGAFVEGGRGVKGLLAPRREVKEVASRQAELDGRLHALRADSAQAVGAATSAEAEARELDEQIHAREKDVVAAGRETQAADDEFARLERKAAVLEAERQQADGERAAAAERLEQLERASAAVEEEKQTGQRLLAERASAVASGRTAVEAAQARLAEAKTGVAALRERAAAAQNDCRRLEGDLAELDQRIGGARARAAETMARRAELTAELAEVERLLAEALVARDQAGGEATFAEERVRESRLEIEGREQGLKQRRLDRDVLRDAIAELDVERARTGSDLDHLARECQQAVGLAAADAAAALGEAELALDTEALAAEVTELRDKLERMGAVNVLAVEQAQEHEERHAFLTAQRQDLLDSISELDQAIRKIDKASRERFQEAFQVINQHFGETFQKLFGGGTAGLSLIDEEDLLESGIDIMAQPPGKRLQSVMLLSGGEKALTAIALLFAIFQYKPSPFCILDEVDAPLDDANIGRFVHMLDGLKEQTQFVLITHSRKTMSIADQLYGVTMEEPGVSKLVSVRFT